MRCKTDVLYLKRVLPLFLLVPLMDSPLLVQPFPIEPKHLVFLSLALVQYLLYGSKCLVQSARLNQRKSLTFVLARFLDRQFCWFNRPRLNRNIWHFLLLVLVQNLLYGSKCLVQSARLNQHRQLYRFFPLRSSRPLR